MTIHDQIAALPKYPSISKFNSSDETQRADAYAIQSDALRASLDLLLELSRAYIEAKDKIPWPEEKLAWRIEVDAAEADLRTLTEFLEQEGS